MKKPKMRQPQLNDEEVEDKQPLPEPVESAPEKTFEETPETESVIEKASDSLEDALPAAAAVPTIAEAIESITLEEAPQDIKPAETSDETEAFEKSPAEHLEEPQQTPAFEIDVEEIVEETKPQTDEDTDTTTASETKTEPVKDSPSAQDYKPFKSEDLPEIDLDADLNRLLIELNEKAQAESGKQQKADSESGDDLLEEALQNIPLSAEEEKEREPGEATDSLLIKPSDSIVPPKRLTEDDLNVVADAESILADFMEPLEDDTFSQSSEEQTDAVRLPEESADGMDEFLKLYDAASKDETNPIHIKRELEEEEKLPPEPLPPVQTKSSEEQEKHNREEFINFIESLKQRGDEGDADIAKEPSADLKEKTHEDEHLSVFSQFEDEESSDPAFDTKKVILEVLSQMDDEGAQQAGKIFDFDSEKENREADGSKAPFFNFEEELDEVTESAEAADAAELAIFDEEFAAVEKSTTSKESEKDLAQVQSIDLSEIEEDQPAEQVETPAEEDIFAEFEELKEEEDPTAPVELSRKEGDDDLLGSLPKAAPSAGLLNDYPVYTCILVPRLSDYSLNSSYAALLTETMSQLSQAFGWEIENLIIQPTYMRWTIKVPPEVSQGFFVRKVRQYTSDKIFSSFPELSKLNPSDNFWAKGYLVVSGKEPPAPEFLDDFIQKNRRPKGIMN